MILDDSLCCRCTAIRSFWVKTIGGDIELWNRAGMRWNRAGIDPATRQIYMKGPSLYNLILHIKWKELKVCEVVVRLLQRIDWLQCKICRGWTLDFGNSKIRNSQCEIGVYDTLVAHLPSRVPFTDVHHPSMQPHHHIDTYTLSFNQAWSHFQHFVVAYISFCIGSILRVSKLESRHMKT